MSNIAIKVENLSKAYQLGEIGTGTISRDLERMWAKARGKEDPFLKIGETNDRTSKGKSDIVWSLKDINFEIEQGDAVGIIGRNGAGKSTLLKILSRVTAPTSGKISGKGRIASLLEVGTGFHPELTGRENIFLNGAILGMRKREIQRKLDEIVDFAGVERYLDTPVKRYSSGMYVRLAFAVAAHLESEILIVDEVLAVGDAEFQKKCLGKMGEVSKGEGRTVLFVSHNMDAVINLCNKGIVLNNGILTKDDLVNESVKSFLNNVSSNFENIWKIENDSFEPQFVEAGLKINGKQPNLELELDIYCRSNSNEKAFFAVDIQNGFGTTIMQAIPSLQPQSITNNSYRLNIYLNGLIPDTYSISLWMGPHNSQTYHIVKNILSFTVDESPTMGRTYPHTVDHGFIVPNSKISKLNV